MAWHPERRTGNDETVNIPAISTDIYWDTPPIWREAQANLNHLLFLRVPRGNFILNLAETISNRISSLEPLLANLCMQTCPDCTNPCCKQATVRYDFRDLILLHLQQKGLPLFQPKPDPGRQCYMLGEKGCTLARYMRPFMCTWYLCPGQMDLVRSTTSGYINRLPKHLREIQDKRKELETNFLQLVS